MTEKKDVVEKAIDAAKPIISKMGFGAVMGYCSGMALHKVGKALAFVIGLGFIGLQFASSSGYLVVDWEKVRLEFVSRVDTNADGSLDHEDVKAYWKKFRSTLANKIPSAGGFSLGFLYGVRSG